MIRCCVQLVRRVENPLHVVVLASTAQRVSMALRVLRARTLPVLSYSELENRGMNLQGA
jgi:hypothetical protein